MTRANVVPATRGAETSGGESARGMGATITVPDRLADDVVLIRRDLHMHPELGFAEHRQIAKPRIGVRDHLL